MPDSALEPSDQIVRPLYIFWAFISAFSRSEIIMSPGNTHFLTLLASSKPVEGSKNKLNDRFFARFCAILLGFIL